MSFAVILLCLRKFNKKKTTKRCFPRFSFIFKTGFFRFFQYFFTGFVFQS